MIDTPPDFTLIHHILSISLFIYLLRYTSISGLAFSDSAFSSCRMISRRCSLKEVLVEEPAFEVYTDDLIVLLLRNDYNSAGFFFLSNPSKFYITSSTGKAVTTPIVTPFLSDFKCAPFSNFDRC